MKSDTSNHITEDSEVAFDQPESMGFYLNQVKDKVHARTASGGGIIQHSLKAYSENHLTQKLKLSDCGLTLYIELIEHLTLSLT